MSPRMPKNSISATIRINHFCKYLDIKDLLKSYIKISKNGTSQDFLRFLIVVKHGGEEGIRIDGISGWFISVLIDTDLKDAPRTGGL